MFSKPAGALSQYGLTQPRMRNDAYKCESSAALPASSGLRVGRLQP